MNGFDLPAVHAGVIAAVMGLTQITKTQFKLEDVYASIVTCVFGLGFGVLYQLAVWNAGPQDIRQVVTLIFAAAITWLSATGVYKVGMSFARTANGAK